MTQRDGIGQEQAQWTMTGFMAAMAGGNAAVLWLLERIGFRKLFLGSSGAPAAGQFAGPCAGALPGRAFRASWSSASCRALLAEGATQPRGTPGGDALVPAA